MYGDKRFCALSRPRPNAQSLFIYLLTGPETSVMPGVLRMGKAQLAEALGWSIEETVRCAEEVRDQGMGHFDWEHRIVWLPKALKNVRNLSPDWVRSMALHFESLPECDLKDAIARGVNEQLITSSQRTEKQKKCLDAFWASWGSSFRPDWAKGLKSLGALPTPASPPPSPPGSPPASPPLGGGGGEGREQGQGQGGGGEMPAAANDLPPPAIIPMSPPPPVQAPEEEVRAAEAMAFFANYQDTRCREVPGTLPEPPPPGGVAEVATVLDEARECLGAGAPQRLAEAAVRFMGDSYARSRTPACPWALFRSQWRRWAEKAATPRPRVLRMTDEMLREEAAKFRPPPPGGGLFYRDASGGNGF